MNLRSKRKLAASVMGVGVDRVVFDPEAQDLIQDAITRSTIRGLVGMGAIKAAPEKGVSRGRARVKAAKKKARGHGSFSGVLSSRSSKKEKWMEKVRALRWRLRVARERGDITDERYWSLYKQVKGGGIDDIRHLMDLIREGRR